MLPLGSNNVSYLAVFSPQPQDVSSDLEKLLAASVRNDLLQAEA